MAGRTLSKSLIGAASLLSINFSYAQGMFDGAISGVSIPGGSGAAACEQYRSQRRTACEQGVDQNATPQKCADLRNDQHLRSQGQAAVDRAVKDCKEQEVKLQLAECGNEPADFGNLVAMCTAQAQLQESNKASADRAKKFAEVLQACMQKKKKPCIMAMMKALMDAMAQAQQSQQSFMNDMLRAQLQSQIDEARRVASEIDDEESTATETDAPTQQTAQPPAPIPGGGFDLGSIAGGLTPTEPSSGGDGSTQSGSTQASGLGSSSNSSSAGTVASKETPVIPQNAIDAVGNASPEALKEFLSTENFAENLASGNVDALKESASTSLAGTPQPTKEGAAGDLSSFKGLAAAIEASTAKNKSASSARAPASSTLSLDALVGDKAALKAKGIHAELGGGLEYLMRQLPKHHRWLSEALRKELFLHRDPALANQIR